MKRAKVNHNLKIVPILVFIVGLGLSYLIIKNLESLDTERKQAEMITISESLNSEFYDAMMKEFSKIYTVRGLFESSKGEIEDFSIPVKALMNDSCIHSIFFAPEGVIRQVYPETGKQHQYYGLNIFTTFAEIANYKTLTQTTSPEILGPYESADGTKVFTVIAPTYITTAELHNFFVGIVGIEVKYDEAFSVIDLDSINKRGYAFRIWRFNNTQGLPLSVLESNIKLNQTNSKNTVTFNKQFFLDPLYYTFSPLSKFYKSPFFIVLAFILLACCVLVSYFSYYVIKGFASKEQAKLYQVQTALVKTQEHIIFSLSNLVENRDSDTGNHVRRTSDYVLLLAEKAHQKGLYTDILSDKYIETIGKAAPMHDIGKIVVSDVVLKKPGKLTPEEFEQIKTHTTEGGRIIKDIIGPVQTKQYTKIASEIATSHHEKWNGTGYPSGLSEQNIPLSARIMAIADVFDALTTPRCYKEPFPFEKAVDIILEGKGTQFDPDLIDVFVECKGEMKKVMEKYSTN